MDYIKGADAEETSLQGYVNATYDELVAAFGEPGPSDGYKSDAEWDGLLDGVVFTIYNWKNGKNYCGAEGADVHYITHWHVGGRSAQAAWNVDQFLKERREK